MRRAVLALVLLGCSTSDVDRQDSPIVNGTIDEGDPATVFLWLGGGSCSGTLISPHVVLTARQCLEGVSVSQLEVFFGTYANGDGTWIRAVDYEYHAAGDIGVVALETAGPATPIPVNARDLSMYLGQPVRIVGFGQTSEYGGGSGVKRMGTTVLDSVEGDIMYTGFVDESWTCYGDSGGPNFMTFDGVEHVVGATSFGTTVCGQPADGSVRTDTYHEWIMTFVDNYDPATCAADGRCAAGCSSPDPDCPCEADGFCDAICPTWPTDVDCAGCGAGDGCREDCPEADEDCEPELPPDAGEPGGGGGGGGAGGEEPEATGDLVGGCAVGGGGGPAWLLVPAILYIWRRRR